jgi:PAS domain S-box-containing protein
MNESFNILRKLREKAEKIIKDSPEEIKKQNIDDVEKLLHELEVHQIELQLQNKELEEARRNLERSENKYFSLYENAPIGFLTLNDVSKIIELNFESSVILSDDKINLAGSYFSNFVAPESQDEFYFHMQKIFREDKVVRSEIKIKDKIGNIKTVLIESKPFLKQTDYNLVLSILIDISEKKKIENNLLIEKESLESIYKIAPVAIFTINENFEIASWNKRCEELTGYNQYSLIGKSIDKLFNLNYFNILKIIRNLNLYNYNKESFETEINKSNGRKIIALVNIAKVNEKNIIITFKDITESKQNESELKLFKNVFENINEPLFIVDRSEDDILYFNRSAVKKTKFNINDLQKSKFSEIFFKNNFTYSDEYRSFIKSENPSKIIKISYQNKSDQIFQLELYLNKINHLSKKYLLIFILDISESKKVEKELERSKYITNAIIDKTPVGLCITDPKGFFEYVNPAYCEIYKYSQEELIGEHFTKVVSDDLKEFMQELHDKFIAGVAEPRGEWQVVDKNGQQLFILADATRITGEDGLYRKVTFVINITSNKKAQIELRNSEARYRRLTENAKDLIYRFLPGPPTKIDFISPAIKEILGYTQEECYRTEGLIEKILDKDHVNNFLNKNNLDRLNSIIRKAYDK